MPAADVQALKKSEMWSHMRQVVSQYSAEMPATSSGVESISQYSRLILQGTRTPGKVTTVYHDPNPFATKTIFKPDAHTNTDWVANYCLKVEPPRPKKSAEDEDYEEETPEDRGELPDLHYEQDLFRSFGEGLSETETQQVNVSLKRLLDKEPLLKARFWGKITGLQADYYIAETKVDEDALEEPADDDTMEPEIEGKPAETIMKGLNGYVVRAPVPTPEEEKKGINEYRYYVATSKDLAIWTLLPDVRPEQIVAARNVRKLLTGVLDAPVEVHPPFPGRERNYLRAQITRISQGTTISPKGILSTDQEIEDIDEDDEEMVQLHFITGPDGKKVRRYEVQATEELPNLSPAEKPDDPDDVEAMEAAGPFGVGYTDNALLELKNWVHTEPALLQTGRCTFYTPETPDDEEEEEDFDAAEVKHVPEWVPPSLGALSHDTPLQLKGHTQDVRPWAVRQGYKTCSSSTATYIARSLLWPGSMCVCESVLGKPGAYHQNMYVGNGLKNNLGVTHAPPLPSLPMREFPTQGVLKLQRDCTRDDELEFEPNPFVEEDANADANEEDEEQDE